ncbi:MAG: acetyl-CoA carboxylase carboxyltransferase subunit beta [Armatimonadota bacterium]
MPDWFKRQAAEVPEGAFTKCASCGAILYTKDFERDLKVCAKCGHHHSLTADERIACTADEGSFVEFANDFRAVDPLAFPGYAAKLEGGAAAPEGRNDGLVVGTATVSGRPCVLAISDFGWGRLAGTMGSVFGEKFCRAADRAIADRSALVTFCASGGARMQEGLFSLMQMAKTSLAVAQLAEAKVPYIVVLTHPSTGGAVASYASLGDVILAEPGATVALSGERVAAQAQTSKVPAHYRTAEFALEHGMLDMVSVRRDLPSHIARVLAFLQSSEIAAVETAREAVLHG